MTSTKKENKINKNLDKMTVAGGFWRIGIWGKIIYYTHIHPTNKSAWAPFFSILSHINLSILLLSINLQVTMVFSIFLIRHSLVNKSEKNNINEIFLD